MDAAMMGRSTRTVRWADLKRREFIMLIGGAAAAWPLAARAQRERIRRVGVLMSSAESDPEAQTWMAAFKEGLQRLGWIEDRNTRIDARWGAPTTTACAATRLSWWE
jgi:hypothetical protein